jgi:hypothetical protein
LHILRRTDGTDRGRLHHRKYAARAHGSRHVGRRACLAVWQGLAGESGTHFEPEEVFVAGDRAIIRWRYFWGAGENNSVRGVNLMRVRGGQIIEAMGT